jgi:Protein of unknown function (DUF2892)
MAKNVGGIDRVLRIVVGLTLIAAAATGMLGVWAYIGVVPLFTSLVGWCPLYQLIGLNSCPVKK